MITFKDNALNYLIEKYQHDTKIGKAILKILSADKATLDGCPNCINEKTLLPNMAALREWTKRYKLIYRDAVNDLEKCLLKTPKNADIYALLGNCYFELNNFSKSLRYYQKAIELDPGNSSLLSAFGDVYTRLGYEIFKRSPKGKKIENWYSNYQKNILKPKLLLEIDK